MNKLYDLISKLPNFLSIPIILQLVVLIGMMTLQQKYPLDRFFPEVYAKTPILAITTTAIVLWIALAVSYILLYLKVRNKLAPRFGIFWDKNKEPFCPACEKPLSEYHFSNIPSDPYYEFTCIHCNKHVRIMHNSKPISLEEAQKLLK